MDKKTLIDKKQKELLNINNRLNSGLKPSFGKIFVGPFVLALLAFLIGKLLKLTDIQSLGLIIVGFLLGLFTFTLRENKRIEKEKAELINKRLVIQQEIVALIREVKNEDSEI